MFILGFPLLLIPFAVYNMIAFLTPGVGWTALSSPAQRGTGGVPPFLRSRTPLRSIGYGGAGALCALPPP
jgi:hypothetical protein